MIEHERISWLKRIYPEFKEEKCFEENVFRPYDLIYFDFFERDNTFGYTEKINPKDIIGIEYAFDYNFSEKINWYELLCRLRRLKHVINNFKTKEDIINHIHYKYGDAESKCVWKFGKHYFTTSGQHRLCLAKFLNVESVEVYVTVFKLNKERLVRYKKIKALANNLHKYHFIYRIKDEELREDSINKDFYIFISKKLVIINIDLIPEFIKYYESFRIYKSVYKIQIFINEFLYPNEQGKNIELKTKEDFNKVNTLIIKHKIKHHSL